MRALLVHWPHVVPVLLGFGAVLYLWVANRRWRIEGQQPSVGRGDGGAGRGGAAGTDGAHAASPALAHAVGAEGAYAASSPGIAQATGAESAHAASPGMAHTAWRASERRTRMPVRREAARRGAIVLGPILAAVATGASIYGIDLAAERPGRGLVWAHVGFSLLVCLLAVYKLAEVDPARVRRAWRTDRALETAGSVLLAALLVPLLLSGIVVLASPSSVSYSAYAHLIASAWWTLLVAWHLARYLARSVGTLRSH